MDGRKDTHERETCFQRVSFREGARQKSVLTVPDLNPRPSPLELSKNKMAHSRGQAAAVSEKRIRSSVRKGTIPSHDASRTAGAP